MCNGIGRSQDRQVDNRALTQVFDHNSRLRYTSKATIGLEALNISEGMMPHHLRR
jgi:hypothetical protein